MGWINTGSGVYSNDTGLTLTEQDGQGVLTIDELEDEGLEVEIPLIDLFENPFTKIATLDANGKLSPDTIPSIVIGDTFYANSDAEMTALSGAQKGDVCIRLDIAGGASYRLMGNNYANLYDWAELRSRYIFWNDVRQKPLEFPPEDHEHTEYPKIGANGKIPASVIPFVNFFGSRYVRNSESAMLALSATPGDVCIRSDENKLYLLMGLPNYLSSWVYIPSPMAKVESIIMKGIDNIGYVEITPEAIGAALETHTHDYPDSLKEIEDNSILQFRFISANEELQFYINNDFIAALSKVGHEHTEIIEINNSSAIRFSRTVINGIPTLLWIDPLNGDTPTPFA
jgi:hypothetical protein